MTSNPSTKDRILDAAEELIARNGYAETSLRSVTSAADVNLAAVHYHFGNKVGLFRALFERRVGDINAERLELLDALEAKHTSDAPNVEQVLEAFLRPVVARINSSDEGMRRFLQVVGRVNADAGEHVEQIADVFAVVSMRFLAALGRALPNLPQEEIFWRFSFLIGSMCTLISDPERVRIHSGGLCDPSDPETVLRQLTAFAAHGFNAPRVAGSLQR